MNDDQQAAVPAGSAEPDPDDDPFAAFDAAMGVGVVSNPYPDFAVARSLGAIHGAVGLDLGAGEGSPDDTGLADLAGLFTAFSFDAVQAVLRDGETFSSAGYAALMGPVFGHSILEMDEPEHHTYRALVQQAFTRKAMERWSTELVEPIVHELVDAFVERGHAELVRELTFPFPVNVIAGLLGLPRADLPRFHRWAVEVIGVSVDYDRAVRASGELRDYLAGILAERRRHPADDVISVLAAAEHDGRRLDDEEIFAFLRLLLPAGAETTYRSSSNLLFGLLTHPDQLDAVRADPALVPAAIEEGLRWEPPLLTIMRTATRDADVCGTAVPAGSMVIVNMGSANHDETRWDDPEAFDVHRPARSHLAFAAGPHTCLGMHLARMETEVLLRILFERLPGLRLDPAAEPPTITGLAFRAPTALPVRFDR